MLLDKHDAFDYYKKISSLDSGIQHKYDIILILKVLQRVFHQQG